MRARLLRPAAGLALVSAAVLSMSASAATKPLVLTDAKGDAFLNDQGTGTFGSAPGPSQDSKDVVALTLAPLPGKACTGYTATVELAGAPSSNTIYRVLGTTAATGLFWVQFDNNPVTGTRATLRTDAATKVLATPAKVEGSKFTLTVLEKDVKDAGAKLASLKVEIPSVDIRTSTGVLTVPSYDTLNNEDKSFKVCS